MALAALFLGAVGIAFAPIFVRLSEVGPVATAFYRLLFALPALWLWAFLEGGGSPSLPRPTRRKDLWLVAAAGLFFAGDLAVWHWAILYTSVANATLLANFAPIFVTLGAWSLLQERFTGTFLTGMAIGLMGAVLLMADSISMSLRHVLGDALGVLTAVFYGAYILSVSRLRSGLSTALIMAWSGTVTCIALFPIALLAGESFFPPSAYGWGVLVALALISHAGGQSLIAFALAHLPAAFSSVGLLLQPVVAALLAWAILSEALRPMQGVGGVIVLAGIAMARRGSR